MALRPTMAFQVALPPQLDLDIWGRGGSNPLKIATREYFRHPVHFRMPGLELKGLVYKWQGNKDTDAQILMKVFAAVMATNEKKIENLGARLGQRELLNRALTDRPDA